MDDHPFEFNDNFADLEMDLELEFETRYIKPPRTKEVSEEFLKYSDAKRLAHDLEFKEDKRYFVLVNGAFYFGDFIEAFIIEKAIAVKSMTISTLSMNENNVDSLANLLTGGYVDELNLLVSDFFYAHERHNLIPYIYEQLDPVGGPGKFQLAAAGTHCKTCIFETHSGRKMVMHGSANLRSSGNLEQFVIEESAALYDFNFQYQSKILEKYQTINKSIRNKRLWQTVLTGKAAKVAAPAKGNPPQQNNDNPRH